MLKKALNAGIENYGKGGYLQWHNISYDETSKTWKIGGKRLSESKTYHVMLPEYLANGNESRLEFLIPNNYVKWETAKEGDKTDLRSDLRKAVIDYLKKQG